MTPRSLALLALVPTALAAGACTSRYSGDTVAASGVKQVSRIDRAVVESYRVVEIGNDRPLVGAGIGAAAGGIGGSAAGHGAVNALATLGGVVAGGVAGALAEKGLTETQAYEYVLRREGGDLVAFVQKDAQPLPVGQRVFLIYGSQPRLVADNGKPAPGR